MTDRVDSDPGGPPTTEEVTVAPGAPRVLDGRYELTAVIGRGGMGDVWEAVDRRLGRTVAVKTLRTDRHHEPGVRLRFEHEARLAARIVNPHVVAVFDAGEQDAVAYLVMERLPGRTLADEIAGGPLGAEQVRDLGRQILDALGAAHEAGLVHRDVKPANVLVAGDGWWKVGDFGIAKTLEASDLDTTATGLVVGTPAYLAPERMTGEPATASTDLYATGMVLHEALTGKRSAASGSPLPALTTTPDDLRLVRPDLPPALTGTIMRALERDPSRRFSSAAEMAAALAPAVGAAGATGGGVGAGDAETVVSRSAAAAGETQVLPAAPTASADPPRRAVPPVLPPEPVGGRRRLSPWVLVFGALLVAAAVAGVLTARIGAGDGGGTIPGGSVRSTTTVVTTAAPVTTTAAPVTTPATKPPKAPKDRGKGHGRD
ncbi:MAG: Serine/threonine-protein kinase PrkC [Actinomycetia bacterium]|nr:Serine/threonine-protein kinase PrkC [Actinomycetes bacterium]